MIKNRIKNTYLFIERIIQVWNEERPTQLAAALAYYGMFSFAPVIYIAITIASLFFDDIPLLERLFQRLEIIYGTEATNFFLTLVKNFSYQSDSSSWVATMVSIGVLFYTASGLFFQLQYSLNRIWGVRNPPNNNPFQFILKRILYLLMVIAIGLLLVVATLGSIVISWISSFLQLSTNLPLISLAGLFILLSLSIALTYKVLPDVKIAWRDVWIGAMLTTFLILLGGFLIGVYFQIVNFGSAFQAAGAFVIIMVGIYYIAQIFLLGAIFTRVYTSTYGSQKPATTD